METYKDIPGYEGLYQASDAGNIKSIVGRYGDEIILKTGRSSAGYLTVTLCKAGKRSTKMVHRLIAEAFLGSSALQVNHKDANKGNNALMNLEYATPLENMTHARHNGRMRFNTEKIATEKRRPIQQFDKSGRLVATFASAHEAARMLGFNRGNISSCCRGVQNHATAHGFVWKYAG